MRVESSHQRLPFQRWQQGKGCPSRQEEDTVEGTAVCVGERMSDGPEWSGLQRQPSCCQRSCHCPCVPGVFRNYDYEESSCQISTSY